MAEEKPPPETDADQTEPQPGAAPRSESEGQPDTAPAADGPSPRARRLQAALGVLLAAVALAGACFAYEVASLPEVAELKTANPSTTAFLQRYQRRTGEEGQPAVRWQPVPLDSIAPALAWAVVVAEDIEFFSHEGFSHSEIIQAVRDALSGRRELRGASTITQQLAKNLWLSPSRNPLRKLKEAVLTRRLERELSKRRILELYLNVVEFGPGVYGAEAAARHYFDKPATALDRHEAAQLAAALPRPASWNPNSRSPGYQRYVQDIEGRLRRADFLERYLPDIAEPAGNTVPPSREPQPADTLRSIQDTANRIRS
ncbi:MAG: monofunctional biosynthetic peptidoglycan transglycosylase [Gemmatimonadetes bacterium]|uniref:Biosynthetic peptidoglycan transglycosylase n=1 Tax=Candidatus Kutchimonas denitrificans TaxID=3056748 RepID=A0AAE4Z6H9_9BACT|nr:monofunctional biosynthetic peptidoglycan transglycosylase [Gemmatimonadota bacterium]NIR74675.1 monofunctional biosynthetic peptidoglycan transglycosylase [Candidatus Kutchimonas denitrificans]NIS01425.1 monofunctional biosynthetic peptidoglycan transglycosylase [Gemmatimonadota bacterium]NIT67166.1 monofunctional biosynthetic peptidoglycan transglycosylase [Gemmatimonadota bacterium]NIU52340.1 monofunctional biosynthetic peptidoglycan transglycosylase [Gemmatimonadota bacterium]